MQGSRIMPEKVAQLKKDKKMLAIVALGVLGMLLLLFSVFAELPEKTEGVNEKTDSQALYEETEKRLNAIIEKVSGAGKTEVMITFDTLEKYVYADDSESETDENGSSEKKEYVIITDENDAQSGLVSTVYLPGVRGVAVICEGGDSALVREEITKLVCAVLGVSSAKVYVTQMVYSE